MTISDDDLVRAIDMMRFDVGETEIWVKKWISAGQATPVTRELTKASPGLRATRTQGQVLSRFP
jgi:hypothetical protein